MNKLILLSGNDFPIEQLHLLIHPPTIKEIGLIGEDKFFSGCEVLRFTKNKLTTEDKNHLENISNFDIIMSIMREKNPKMQESKANALLVLSLLFPTYEVSIDTNRIKFVQGDLTFYIDSSNYDCFVSVLNELLGLDGSETTSDYNPSGTLASKIADKLRDRHAKLTKQGKEGQETAILSRYISILAVGENKDMNTLLSYTCFQIFDEFERFQLKEDFEHQRASLLAGAKKEDVGEITN